MYMYEFACEFTDVKSFSGKVAEQDDVFRE